MDRTHVARAVRESIAEVLPDLPASEISENKRLIDLGANSVDRAEIVMLSLESLSLSIPATRLSGARDIGTLIDTIAAALGVSR